MNLWNISSKEYEIRFQSFLEMVASRPEVIPTLFMVAFTMISAISCSCYAFLRLCGMCQQRRQQNAWNIKAILQDQSRFDA